MKRSLLTLIMLAYCVAPGSIAQVGVFAQPARQASIGLLTRLTNPRNTPFRVGIVTFETGFLIPPKGAAPVLEYLKSENGSFTADIGSQMIIGETDYLEYRVIRKILTPENCPRLSQAIDTFYSELEDQLPAQISLTTLPPQVELGPINIEYVDYKVQIQLDTAVLVLRLPQSTDPLQQAISGLIHLGSECSEAIEGSVEVHH